MTKISIKYKCTFYVLAEMKELIPGKNDSLLLKTWKLAAIVSMIYLTAISVFWYMKKFDFVVLVFVLFSFVHFLVREEES
jgi:hypothetical protein